MKDWSRERWRRLYLSETLQEWGTWPLMARCIRDYLVRIAEDDGTLISRGGANAFELLVRILHPHPEEDSHTRAACRLLLDEGYLLQSSGRIWIADFEAMQATLEPARRALSGAERQRRLRRRRLSRFLERHGDRCRYCGRRVDAVDPSGPDGATRDHIHPRCQGGTDDPDNLILACRSCNSRKGGRTPEEAGMVLQ